METNQSERPVLIFDGLNAFIRCYAASPVMSSHGYQMGGCIGFLRTMRKLVNEIQPSAVYVCWEGGGSSRRRALLPEYKLNRCPEKLNRFYGDDIPDSEENRHHQLITLLAMIKHVPVCQLYASDCEGDDLVAFLCCGPLKALDKIIVSSDKDLYQLLDSRTRTYSLHRKCYVTHQTVFEEYRVKSQHFAIAKALCGDAGDNVPGIKGVGFKTVAKLFPMLGLEESILLQDVISYSHAHASESKTMQRISDNTEIVKRNWKLVFLDGSMVPAEQQELNTKRIESFKPHINKTGLIKALVKEGIGDFDTLNFFDAFHCIDGMTYSTSG